MIKKLFVLLICIVLLTSCGVNDVATKNPPASGPAQKIASTETSSKILYNKISAREAHEMMSAAEKFILLDVRTEKEYKEKRIAGAILIPHFEIANRAGRALPDKNAMIFIYCEGGIRSANAAGNLAKMGYTKVYDFGGIKDWPYETVKD